MSVPFDDLSALADLDVELVALERSSGALPARTALTDLGERFAGLERARVMLEQERAPLASALSALEVEVAHLAERKTHVDARLATATGGGRELEAMHTEARHLAERLRGLEDQELELMEAIEPLDDRLASLAQETVPMIAERDKLVASLAEQETELERTLAEHHAARAEVVARIEPTLVARYDKVASREGVTGAARLEHQTCTGCHLAISSAEADRLRHLPVDEISTCVQCDRILIRPDQLTA